MSDPRKKSRRWLVALCLAGCCVAPRCAAGQPAANPVAAKVNEQPIHRDEVERLVRQALRGRTVAGEALTILQARMLAQAIDRRLIQAYLSHEKLMPEKSVVDDLIKSMKDETAAKKIGWEQYLAQTGMSEEALRHEVAWKEGWGRYTARETTTKMLEAYFQQHRRELDGTKLRVRHLLFRPARSGDSKAALELLAQAKEVREQIIKAEISFAAAAEKYSAGPSRLQGGDLGFIPRHGRMAEEFSRAAFALAKDEISSPVISSSGIHLIQWTEEEAGAKTVADVREALQAGVAQELFEALAARERPTAKVEFTGAYPYLKPGTKEVVTP